MSVLLCNNITKKKKKNNQINGFSFNFLDKKIYGIVGKSNSGKDLLLDLLSDKAKPTTGDIWVDGEKLTTFSKMKHRVCYIKKNTFFFPLATINTILKSMNLRFPKWDSYYAYTLCKYFNIKVNSIYAFLPTNKKKIFHSICSLASLANVTIFDDALYEVDVKDRNDFFNFLYEHHQRYPRTIIISTDHIDEISYLFDKVLFLDKGKLFKYFTINELTSNFRYLTGKSEVLRSLISGVKIIGAEERDGVLTVCIRKKLTKDDRRKYQKYLIDISEVPIQKIFIYLINLRENRNKKYDIL